MHDIKLVFILHMKLFFLLEIKNAKQSDILRRSCHFTVQEKYLCQDDVV